MMVVSGYLANSSRTRKTKDRSQSRPTKRPEKEPPILQQMVFVKIKREKKEQPTQCCSTFANIETGFDFQPLQNSPVPTNTIL